MQEQQQCSIALGDVEALHSEVRNNLFTGNAMAAEQQLAETLRQWGDAIMLQGLQDVLAEPRFRAALRALGARRGQRYHHDGKLTIVLPGGTRAEVQSPWFTKTAPTPRKGRKGKKRKRGPNGGGCHLALELFGLVRKTFPGLAARGLRSGILCPSFEIASQMLAEDGIKLLPKQIQQLVAHFAGRSGEARAALSSETGESLAGKRVAVLVDGGRCRERVNKSGPPPEPGKCRPYSAEWKEPLLFAIGVLDAAGEIERSFPMQVDGTLGGKGRLLKALGEYLQHLDIAQAAEVIVLGDGAVWQWRDIPALLKDLGVPAERIHEVLDYTHAKQSLLALRKHFFCSHERTERDQRLGELLYAGNITGLRAAVLAETKNGRHNRVCKKLDNYFIHNAHRMQYQAFEQAGIPRGSGVIESAIRRVINLRIKAPGSFWKASHAEAMIFLRSKLLYGRWQTLWANLTASLREDFARVLRDLDEAAA